MIEFLSAVCVLTAILACIVVKVWAEPRSDTALFVMVALCMVAVLGGMFALGWALSVVFG